MCDTLILHWSTCLVLRESHGAFTAVALENNLRSGIVMCTALFFPLLGSSMWARDELTARVNLYSRIYALPSLSYQSPFPSHVNHCCRGVKPFLSFGSWRFTFYLMITVAGVAFLYDVSCHFHIFGIHL